MVLYDLCCGEGGVARVAIALGWNVIGVDIVPQPNYPGEFILADALSPPLKPVADLTWASPPCQPYCYLSSAPSKTTVPRIVNPIREVAKSLSPHYVIENVQGCFDLRNPIRLCGYMFGVPLIRHRLFETSFMLPQLKHRKHGSNWLTVAGTPTGTLEQRRSAMGFPDMSSKGLNQAVPFAYTWYILTWFINTKGGTIYGQDNKT